MKAIMAAAAEHTYRMVDLINVENAHEPDSGGHHPRRRTARMALFPREFPCRPVHRPFKETLLLETVPVPPLQEGLYLSQPLNSR
jgi:hypothetical protein